MYIQVYATIAMMAYMQAYMSTEDVQSITSLKLQ